MLVAGLFGLGHAMALSFTLADLRLSTGQPAVSLLGFDPGTELLQLKPFGRPARVRRGRIVGA